MSRPIVLVFARYYLPGFKAGGPVRSIDNLVGHLGDEFDFHVVTSDRDLGDGGAYPGVTAGARTKVRKATVTYLSPGEQSFGGICRLLRTTPHDAVYLNSFFDPVFSAVPLLVRRFGLAPRKPIWSRREGSFLPGRLRSKRGRSGSTFGEFEPEDCSGMSGGRLRANMRLRRSLAHSRRIPVVFMSRRIPQRRNPVSAVRPLPCIEILECR